MFRLVLVNYRFYLYIPHLVKNLFSRAEYFYIYTLKQTNFQMNSNLKLGFRLLF